MRKKKIIERLDAIRTESAALLEAETFDAVRGAALSSEQDTLSAELAQIEALEAKIKANGAKPGVVLVKDNGADAPWESMGHFLQAVARASHGPRDSRLKTDLGASGANESIGSEGGFLVDVDTAAGLIERTYNTGVIASKCAKQPISANSNGVKLNGVDETSRANGSRYGGIRAYWASEAAQATSSQPKFRKVELDLKKLLALCYSTDELLADAVALTGWLNRTVPQELAFVLDDALMNGSGAGQPLGILNANCLVSQAAEGSQTSTTFNWNNASKMLGRMWAPSVSRAEWFLNQDVWNQILLLTSAATSASTPMFVPPGAVADAPFGMLYGRKINVIEQAQTLGTVGDIVLADWSQYVLAEKGGVNAASSMHVRFLYDEMTFRFTLRVDGRPLWHDKLTPFKGSNTISPFVALAAR